VADMTDKVRKRLSQLFALLGSDNVHEREVARQKLDEWLRKNKRNWNDLVELLQTGSSDVAWQDDEQAETAAPNVRSINALELVKYVLEQYVDMQPHEYIGWALWILHSHVFNRFMVSPRLAFTSPVRGCGKTTAFALTEALSARAQRMDGVTAAAIYRMIDSMHCTLLIDEADNLGLMANGSLRAVLNSGHRKGGRITRVIRDQPKRFSTFAPMAIAAIGILPLPIMARSIVIHMERTDGTHVLKRLEASEIDDPNSELNIIYRQIFEWARGITLDPDPEMPAELRNRPADNWRPLLSVADSFGPAWSKAAREAAITFHRSYHDEDIGVVLLADILTIFNTTRADRIASEQLVAHLNDMDDAGWSEWRGLRDDQRPRPLSQAQPALILKNFGIRPRSIWPPRRKPGAKSRKGYLRSQFEKAWRQYCSQDGTAAQNSNVRQLRK
jgi:uncharacterized protein DUF3631